MTTLAELYSALKYRVEVDQYGTRRYYNNKGEMHREDSPAVEWVSYKEWWLKGVQYTEQGYHAQLKTLEQAS